MALIVLQHLLRALLIDDMQRVLCLAVRALPHQITYALLLARRGRNGLGHRLDVVDLVLPATRGRAPLLLFLCAFGAGGRGAGFRVCDAGFASLAFGAAGFGRGAAADFFPVFF